MSQPREGAQADAFGQQTHTYTSSRGGVSTSQAFASSTGGPGAPPPHWETSFSASECSTSGRLLAVEHCSGR